LPLPTASNLKPNAAESADLQPLACEISARKKRSEFNRAQTSNLSPLEAPPSDLWLFHRPSSVRSDHPSSIGFASNLKRPKALPPV